MRNSIDAVYDDARAVRGVMRDGKKISDFLEYSNDTEAQKRLQEEGTKKHGPFPPDPTLLSKSN